MSFIILKRVPTFLQDPVCACRPTSNQTTGKSSTYDTEDKLFMKTTFSSRENRFPQLKVEGNERATSFVNGKILHIYDVLPWAGDNKLTSILCYTMDHKGSGLI